MGLEHGRPGHRAVGGSGRRGLQFVNIFLYCYLERSEYYICMPRGPGQEEEEEEKEKERERSLSLGGGGEGSG